MVQQEPHKWLVVRKPFINGTCDNINFRHCFASHNSGPPFRNSRRSTEFGSSITRLENTQSTRPQKRYYRVPRKDNLDGLKQDHGMRVLEWLWTIGSDKGYWELNNIDNRAYCVYIGVR